MATKKQGDRVGAMIADVEALAKRLRTEAAPATSP